MLRRSARGGLDGVWIALAGIVVLVDPGIDGRVVGACRMANIYLSKHRERRSRAAGARAAGSCALIVLPAGVIQAEGALVEPTCGLGARGALLCRRKTPAPGGGVARRCRSTLAALAGFVVLDQALGGRELLAIAMVVVASAGAASLSHR